ncbi:uncharacterized protein ARMOST_08210 [Armillaria ostoyae]|uniref:Uncharacterized protein n=1 Tax=Armillaria ostoyae TaxID=47428 RepID=A0A284R827_ARMOS|nr:uncharacterized protein ARMOST_08210 [Armillaria ostoyae]
MSQRIVGNSNGFRHNAHLAAELPRALCRPRNLQIHLCHAIDKYGGLRLNLSGSSKLPANHDDDLFPAEHETVIFVGRPFPLTSISLVYDDGDVLSFLVMSQAVERARPLTSDGFRTLAVHVDSEPDPITGTDIPPISLSTTFAQSSVGVHKDYEYSQSRSYDTLGKLAKV